MTLLSANLAIGLSALLSDWFGKYAKQWAVFLLCLFSSMIGVYLSFKLFVPTLTAFPNQREVGIAIAVIMLGVNYGAKYANPSAREVFTPLDLIQYLSQGFLWPSVWPSLATFLHITPVDAPSSSSFILLNPLAAIVIFLEL